MEAACSGRLSSQRPHTLAIPGDQRYIGKTVRMVAISSDILGCSTEFSRTGLITDQTGNPLLICSHHGSVTNLKAAGVSALLIGTTYGTFKLWSSMTAARPA